MNGLKIVADEAYKDAFKAQISQHDSSVAYNAVRQDAGKDYWLVASHSDKLINNRIYKPSELQKLGDTYLHPYPKPVLLHHNDESEPVGRIVDAEYVPATDWQRAQQLLGDDVPLPPGASGALLLKAHITDPQAIQKIEDGRYMTVSIGFSAASLKCSICGQDWVSEGPCEHEFGQIYDGQLAYGVPENMHAMEISFVNVPADDYAQVVKTSDKAENEAAKDAQDADVYTFVRKNAGKTTVLFTDNVNLPLATCGVTSHTKDYKESEEKGEMAEKAKKVNNKADEAAAEDKVSMLSDSLKSIQDALVQLIRMQIANYDAISGKETDGLDESSDIASLMDALTKSKQAADEFLKDECEDCEEETDNEAVEDEEANAEESSEEDMSADALQKVTDGLKQITDALVEMQKQFADSFAAMMDKLNANTMSDAQAETEASAEESPKGENEAKVEDGTQEVKEQDSDTTVMKETNPAAAPAVDSEANKPRTLREIFSRTFRS